jgi:hypothetical protein
MDAELHSDTEQATANTARPFDDPPAQPPEIDPPLDRRSGRHGGRRWSDLSAGQQTTLVEKLTALNSHGTPQGPPLEILAEACAVLDPACDFSLTLVEANEAPRCVVSSSDRARILTERQIEDNDGPTIEAVRRRSNLLGLQLAEVADRWPRFTPLATAVGYLTMNVIVLGADSAIVGALSAFGREDPRIRQPRVDLLTGIADAGATAMANHTEQARLTQLSDQLQVALHSRVVIEQAKGILAARLAVDTEAAFSLLRRYARNNGKRVHDVASDVIEGKVSALELRLIGRRHTA